MHICLRLNKGETFLDKRYKLSNLLFDQTQIVFDLRIPSSLVLSHLFLLHQSALPLVGFFPFQLFPFFLSSLLLALFVCIPFLKESFFSLLLCLLLQENPLLRLIEQSNALNMLLFTLLYSLFIYAFIFFFDLVQQVIPILFQSLLLVPANSVISFIFLQFLYFLAFSSLVQLNLMFKFLLGSHSTSFIYLLF